MGMGLDRAWRDPQSVGDRRLGPVGEIAQDEDLALSVWQPVERSEHRAVTQVAHGFGLGAGGQRAIGDVGPPRLGDQFAPHDDVVPLHRSGTVDDGAAQVADRSRGFADPVVVAVGRDESVLDDVFGRALVVQEQPRQPHERVPVGGIQGTDGVVGRRAGRGRARRMRGPARTGALQLHRRHAFWTAECGRRLT